MIIKEPYEKLYGQKFISLHKMDSFIEGDISKNAHMKKQTTVIDLYLLKKLID